MKVGLISVILPVWKPNTEQLRHCILSVLNQTYSNFELIISYRKSQNIDEEFHSLLNEFSDEHRIKLIENKILGFTNSLNDGIINSTGEFIARIDGDDFCELNRFEKQLEFKKTNSCNIVGSWAYLISEEGKKIGKIEVPISHSEIRKKIMLHNPILHPSVLMDKKMLEDAGSYDTTLKHNEDYELWFRLISKNYRFGNVPEYLINIRETISSRTRGSDWRRQRKYNVKIKNKALLKYGFTTPRDFLYYIIAPLSLFVSPRFSLKAKKLTGWYK